MGLSVPWVCRKVWLGAVWMRSRSLLPSPGFNSLQPCDPILTPQERSTHTTLFQIHPVLLK